MFVWELYIVSCIRLMVLAVSSAFNTLVAPSASFLEFGFSRRMANPPPRAVAVLIGPNEKKEMLT